MPFNSAVGQALLPVSVDEKAGRSAGPTGFLWFCAALTAASLLVILAHGCHGGSDDHEPASPLTDERP